MLVFWKMLRTYLMNDLQVNIVQVQYPLVTIFLIFLILS